MSADDRIERSIDIDVPVRDAWVLLTDLHRLPTWWPGLASADGEVRPGGAIVMRWHEHGTTQAVVEQVEPPHRFAYRWSHRDDAPPTATDSTLVTFTLQAVDAGTRVTVVETGFAGLVDGPLPGAGQREQNEQGWTTVLGGLRGHAAAHV